MATARTTARPIVIHPFISAKAEADADQTVATIACGSPPRAQRGKRPPPKGGRRLLAAPPPARCPASWLPPSPIRGGARPSARLAPFEPGPLPAADPIAPPIRARPKGPPARRWIRREPR